MERSPGEQLAEDNRLITDEPIVSSAPEQTDVLGEDPTTVELGNELETLAQRVREYDHLPFAPESIINTGISATALPLSFTGLLGIEALHDVRTTANIATLYITIRGLSKIFKGKHRQPLHLPDGYTLQALRAKESAYCDKNEVVVAVHPRVFPHGESEDASHTRTRFSQALEVCALAPSVDKVLVPELVLRKLGLPLIGKRPYKDIAQAIVPTHIKLPAQYEHARGVLIPQELCGELADMLQAGKQDPLLRRTIHSLAERFPLVRERLMSAETPEQLLPTIHTLLQRTVDAELPAAQRERYHDSLGNYHDERIPLVTSTDVRNPYEPRVIQRRTPNYATVEDQTLRELSGGDQSLADIVHNLRSNKYSNLQLLAVTFQLLKQHKQSAEADRVEEQHSVDTLAAPKSVTGGDVPPVIEPEMSSRSVLKAAPRVLARLALAGVVVASSLKLIDIGLEASGLGREIPPISVGNVPPDIWKTDAHNMETTGYWTQTMSYYYDAKTGWQTAPAKGDKPTIRQYPTSITDTTVPHIDVSTITNEYAVALPLLEHTVLGSLAAYDKDGNTLPASASINTDGTIQAYVSNPTHATYKLTYTLIGSSGTHLHATRPLDVSGSTSEHSNRYPLARLGARAQASYMRHTFTYDANKAHERHLTSFLDTPDAFVDEIYQSRRCECERCNQAVAFTQAGIQSPTPTAYSQGFFKDEADSPDFLPKNGHAWLRVNWDIVDATPKKQDAESVLSQEPPRSIFKQRWDKQNHKLGTIPPAGDKTYSADTIPIEILPNTDISGLIEKAAFPLGGLAGAALAYLELRRRPLRRSIRALYEGTRWRSVARNINMGDALSFMAWHAYAQPDTPMPTRPMRITPAQPANFTTQTLQEIKAGNFRGRQHLRRHENRALRRMAKLLLTERNRHSN